MQPEPSGKQIQIICGFSGRLLCELCSLPPKSRVSDLISRLAVLLEIREAEQRLVLDGRCLHAHEDLAAALTSSAGHDVSQISLVRLDPCWVKKIDDLKIGALSLSHADAETLRTIPDAVLAAVSWEDGQQLQYAAEFLRNDQQFLIAVVQANYKALRHIESPWNANPDIVSAALSVNLGALEYKSWGDKRLLLSLVSKFPLALQYASKRLRADAQVVAAAVCADGRVLQHAAPCRRADKQTVLLAVRQNARALQAASKHLHGNREIMMVAVAQDGLLLALAPEQLQADVAVVKAAAFQNFKALRYASYKLLDDLDFMLTVVKIDGRSFRFASRRLRADVSVVLAAASNNVKALKFADKQAAIKAIALSPCDSKLRKSLRQ